MTGSPRFQLEDEIGRLLVKGGMTLSVAESCTGGLLGHKITAVSGSSEYFLGGMMAYSNEVKKELLGVDPLILREHGAVSEPVAKEMAEKIRRLFHTDIGLSITGIAGPEGGTPEKPLGLVYIGLAGRDRTLVRRFVFEGNRLEVKDAASNTALQLLKDHLTGQGE